MTARLWPTLALLPMLAFAAEHDHDHHHDHDHDNPGAHEHGVARMNLVLESGELLIELESPAANLLGFEHVPTTADERNQAAAVRSTLEQPLSWLGLAEGADCKLAEQHVTGEVLEEGATAEQAHTGHSDIDAQYRLECAAPEALQTLDLTAFFSRFPGTEQLLVQLIGPNGQTGIQLSAEQPRLPF